MSSQPQVRALVRLTEGQEIPFGAGEVTIVSADLAERFRDGDHLIVVQSTGALLLIPAAVGDLAADAVADAGLAFAELADVTDEQITDFFDRFAAALADDAVFALIADANAADVAGATAKGRSTTRLVLDDRMRTDMVSGLRGWSDSPSRRGGVVDRVEHQAWAVETHAAGHALFADRRLALAVARGSGAAVAELGAVASQSGTPVSLHGTGGAWLIAGRSATATTLHQAVLHSLDRKVCNTLNVLAVLRERARELVPVALAAFDQAASERNTSGRLHVVAGSETHVSADRFERNVAILRAVGVGDEPAASTIDESGLATEWEWEHSPEITLVVVDSVDEAVDLCNRFSPRFVASLVTDDAAEFDRFYAGVDAPFVGNGFTRWVDGQYALNAPELGLSNWQFGRMLGRGAILSGDSVHTIRYQASVTDHTVHR